MQPDYNGILHTQLLINNTWSDSEDNRTFAVDNPATGEILAHVADSSEKDIKAAIEAAHTAFTIWKSTTATERAAMLKRWFSLIIQHADALALLMTSEQGKPIEEAKAEIFYGASFIEWFAEESRRVYGETIPTPDRKKRILTIRQPIGVVAAITPWNFPVSMITRKIAPALAAGCTVIVKPPSETPLSALALGHLAMQAGFPAGVLNIVCTSNAAMAGEVLTQHPLIKKVSFTGSTAVGKKLMQQCAATLKKVSLELGGNAPSIIFDDADLNLAVKATLISKYRNGGQTCVCTNRIFVHENVFSAFIGLYKQEVEKLVVGNGTQKGVNIGPLINQTAIEKVERLLNDAVKEGAVIVAGGQRLTAGNLFFEPTIIKDCKTSMQIHAEEIFGPVAAFYSFKSEEEVIQMANDTPYGLAAYFFSQNINRVWRVAEALEYGMIGINEGIISHAEAPFGGIKESGIGREGSKYGINEYVEIKYLCMGVTD